MAKTLKMTECMLPCNNCKKSYDMSALSLDAKQKQRRNLYCPNCGKKVGTLQ